MDIIISAIVIGIAGGILGCILTNRMYSKKPMGVLRIDSSDPDGPYLFLELETDPNVLKKERYITLKVDTKSYISH